MPAIAATRPWPAPPAGESDFIIRDPKVAAHLVRCATAPTPGAWSAIAILTDHNAAVDAMIQMDSVWRRYLDGGRT